MVDNRISKVFVSSVAALLLLSSVVFLAGTQADASDDLQILDIFEPDGTPPPRENIEYDYIVKWRNVGDDAYTAKEATACQIFRRGDLSRTDQLITRR